MSWRQRLALLMLASGLIVASARLGAIAIHRPDAPVVIDDGAIDFAEDRPVSP